MKAEGLTRDRGKEESGLKRARRAPHGQALMSAYKNSSAGCFVVSWFLFNNARACVIGGHVGYNPNIPKSQLCL